MGGRLGLGQPSAEAAAEAALEVEEEGTTHASNHATQAKLKNQIATLPPATERPQWRAWSLRPRMPPPAA
jgi:hypothetical protein